MKGLSKRISKGLAHIGQGFRKARASEKHGARQWKRRPVYASVSESEDGAYEVLIMEKGGRPNQQPSRVLSRALLGESGALNLLNGMLGEVNAPKLRFYARHLRQVLDAMPDSGEDDPYQALAQALRSLPLSDERLADIPRWRTEAVGILDAALAELPAPARAQLMLMYPSFTKENKRYDASTAADYQRD